MYFLNSSKFRFSSSFISDPSVTLCVGLSNFCLEAGAACYGIPIHRVGMMIGVRIRESETSYLCCCLVATLVEWNGAAAPVVVIVPGPKEPTEAEVNSHMWSDGV